MWLTFHLDDLDFARSPGAFRPDTRMFSLHRNLEDFGSTKSTVGWTCVCHLFNDSLLDSVLGLTAVGNLCVLNLLHDFRNSAGLLHHLWFLHLDDLFNRDSLQWNAVNNLNDLLHRTIMHALLCSDLHYLHDFFHDSD